MGFHNELFPDNYNFNWIAGPGFNTEILGNNSGVEVRIARWGSSKRRYNLSYEGVGLDDVYSVIEFFEARSGATHTFKFRNWFDYTTAANGRDAVTPNDVQIAVGDAVETDFQMVKKYVSGGQQKIRPLTKIELGTARIALDAVEQGSGWTIGESTGMIQFSTPPGDGEVISGGVKFYDHVRFSKETDQFLQNTLANYNRAVLNNIELVEVLNEEAVHEDIYHGGAKYLALTGNATLSLNDGYFFDIHPDAGGYIVTLPDYTNLFKGRNYISFKSNSPNFTVKDHLGNTLIATTTDQQIYESILAENLSGDKLWVVG